LLLEDIKFINIVKSKIKETKKQYSLPVYNLDNREQINTKELQFTINSHLFLETLLMEIRGKSISYSSHKKKEMLKEENKLIKENQNLEVLNSTINNEELQNKKLQIVELRCKKIKGNIVRSRVKWILDGAKPTQYFCNLESRKFTNKIIPHLLNNKN